MLRNDLPDGTILHIARGFVRYVSSVNRWRKTLDERLSVYTASSSE